MTELKRASRLNGVGRIGRRVAVWVWWAINGLRRVLVNLLVLGIVIAALVAVCSSDGPEIHDSTALVVAPQGTLVEQKSGDPSDRLLGSITGEGQQETLLRDVLDAIRFAKDDARVKALLLDLSKFQGGGLSKLQEVADALRDYKESGKPLIATADNYSQGSYYLAALADEVFVHELGGLQLQGFGRYRTYYRDAIDRLEVDWNIFRVGKFKSAVEPYLRNDMSPAAREANLAWLGDLWAAYIADVAAARGLEPNALTDYAENFERHLQEARGDAAQAALAAGLVDKVAQRDVVQKRMIELVGYHEEKHSFHQVALGPYVAQMRERDATKPKRGPAVGVIVARGTIMDGKQPAGSIGGDSTAALIRKARHDDDIKAIVLRVDSGGGSAFASEIIRREFELARAEGKPVVVSMGSVAASGGYWISTASDEIWASPTTITGSIGIFGMFPTFQKPMEKYLGARVDGVATAPGAGMRVDRALDPRLAAAYQTGIENGYRDFLDRVSEARGMTPEEVDKIAQGRVWSGTAAHERGLVDKLGGLDGAVASAASRAELEEGAYRVEYVERELELKERLAKELFNSARAWIIGESIEEGGVARGGPYSEVLALFAEQARLLASFNDPNGLYAYEMIDVD
ncbi:MAG: signal peptide peptidase SppA [Myxococcales bacterium]|nr:signal peptide peptidase SppA [Myxococcales bacterium]MCB9753303.1 signal peptide peptidase SppA [Myxococcales bacterium]